VTLRAGKVELALPSLENTPSGVDKAGGRRIASDVDWQPLRLVGDVAATRDDCGIGG
jgi:hypothetical protein